MTSGANPRSSVAGLFVFGKLAHPDAAAVLARALGLQEAMPMAGLEAALEAGQPCAVLWADPAPSLAATLTGGAGTPTEALADWQAGARALLELQRRHRRRMVLLSEAALSSDAPETIAQLQDRLGLAERLPALPPAAESPAALLAALALREIEPLQPVLAELEAASLYSARPPFAIGRLDQAARQLQADREQETLLKEQLRLTLEAAETATRAAEDIRSEAAGQITALARAQADARQADEARGRAESELAKLRAEMEKLQEQARVNLASSEALRSAAQKAQTEAAEKAKALTARIENLTSRLAQGEASVRAAETARTDAEQERALLREQIRLMAQALTEAEAGRAEMETLRAAALQTDRTVARALADTRQAAEARRRAEGEAAHLRAEMEGLRRDAEQLAESQLHMDRMAADLASLHERLIARENDLAALRSWTDEIFASNSWKVTAPLRRVSLMLGRHRA